MPSKNTVKNYFAGGYYHIYNRGVEKRTIFLDDQDCKTFLYYIKLYLSSPETISSLSSSNIRLSRFVQLNLSLDVDLLCFALMPNHFHLFLKNKTTNGVRIFMQRLITAYVMYFNAKYDRIGALFQGRYKASCVLNDPYAIHLSRYIHNNAMRINNNGAINFSDYSSYSYYLNKNKSEWLNTSIIMEYFKEAYGASDPVYSYKKFVESDISDSQSLLESNDLLLESNCI